MRPFRVRWAKVTIDCLDVERVGQFWTELLGVALVEPGLPGWARTEATVEGGPVLNFQPVPDRKLHKVRLHLDLWTDDLPAASAWVVEHHGSYTGECHL